MNNKCKHIDESREPELTRTAWKLAEKVGMKLLKKRLKATANVLCPNRFVLEEIIGILKNCV